jgi:hypothetical protein
MMRLLAQADKTAASKEEGMQGCLIGFAALLALLGLAVVKLRLRAPHVRPGLLLRGCVALICLLAAAALAGLALWAAVVMR